MPIWKRAAIFGIAATVTSVFFVNFCATVFQCGCTWLWAGAADHCNIHTGPKHCPWCAISPSGQAAVWLSIILPQACISFATPLGFAPRLAASIGAFPACGLITAVIVGIWTGYWN